MDNLIFVKFKMKRKNILVINLSRMFDDNRAVYVLDPQLLVTISVSRNISGYHPDEVNVS